ncbi:MAG: VPLPA-CTERM sorting domain-containing protein [Sedimentitalea sp.]|nr:VPLPA-CTERM sorting domain-containing protein [Sedimentitalea sp.]
MNWKLAIGAAAIALSAPFAASAATVQANGVLVNIYQKSNTGNLTNTADATLTNALAATYIGSVSFTGALHFDTDTSGANPPDTTTINQWLTSKGGSYTELGGGFDENLTISSEGIINDTALTTWFEFLGVGQAFTFDVTHDDGFCFYDSGTTELCAPDPTSVAQTLGGNYSGGVFQLVYAATNGDPSVLRVDGEGSLSAVPLPAGLPLLLAGIGGLALLRRRKS